MAKRSTDNDATVRGLLALESDRERAAPLIAQLREGARTWEELTQKERRILAGAPIIEFLQEKAYALRFDDPDAMVSLSKAACLRGGLP